MKPDIIHIAALEAKDARIKELEEALAAIENYPDPEHDVNYHFRALKHIASDAMRKDQS